MSLLFANFSSDQICLQTSAHTLILAHQQSEYDIPCAYKTLMDKDGITDIVMLNGPWWFTGLRIWSLVCNMMHLLYPDRIRLYNLSKIALYQLLRDILPTQVVMRIWQQKNYRLYDLQSQSYDLIQDIWGYQCFDTLYGTTHALSPDQMITVQVTETWLLCLYWDKSMMLTWWDLAPYQTDHIDAQYYIQAHISPPKMHSSSWDNI